MSKTPKQRALIAMELDRIANGHDGLLRPDDVVVAAAEEESPLHDEFEWDDSIAGPKYRIEQARALIRSVTVTIVRNDVHTETVAFVRDPDQGANEQGYCSVASLVDDHERARSAVLAEYERAAAALRRAHEISIALGLGDEISAAVETINALQSRARVVERPRVQ